MGHEPPLPSPFGEGPIQIPMANIPRPVDDSCIDLEETEERGMEPERWFEGLSGTPFAPPLGDEVEMEVESDGSTGAASG